jgi:predicted nucleotide-binding protein (sugar kinase/HSP70/actin superfamily)
MKVTFPHMGNTYIAIKVLLEELGVDVITPPKCTQETLNLGSTYSPEQMCMPFKINMGNLIESIRLGADTVIMLGSSGICRFGLYNDLQKDILYDLGYAVEMICFEPLGSLEEVKEFLKVLSKVARTKNFVKVFSAFKKGLEILFTLDEVDHLSNIVRAKETTKGVTNRIVAEQEERLSRIRGYKDTLEVIKRTAQKLNRVKTRVGKNALKIGIVGEIYTIVEPFVNMNLVRTLGNMGVEVHKSMTASEFIKEKMDFLPFIKSGKKSIFKAARPYLAKEIGGHTVQTIGNTVQYSQRGFDGVIHLLPLTCMPEIVAMSILPTVSKEKNIPVLSLVVDELSGEGGYLTRVEAFVDSLYQKKTMVR